MHPELQLNHTGFYKTKMLLVSQHNTKLINKSLTWNSKSNYVELLTERKLKKTE